MPKKTKKQKLASERRKLQFFQKPQAQIISSFQPELTQKNEEPKVEVISVKNAVAYSTSTLFIKNDLTKSLLICGLVLFIMIGIYIQQHFGILPVNNFIK